MISKAKIKFIKSLQIKKYRIQEQCFIVEGTKSITELIESDYVVSEVIGTVSFVEGNYRLLHAQNIPFTEVSVKELQSMGSFKTNESALAIVQMRIQQPPVLTGQEYALVLDDIRDPGNMGTIIRTADWYGITNIIVSPDSTDFYNPKVIASSMGSFTRVHMYYTNLVEFVQAYGGDVYGAFLGGENVYNVGFGKAGLVVMGNESNGISEQLAKLVTKRIMIPRIGQAESLNVATATAVILDNLQRKG